MAVFFKHDELPLTDLGLDGTAWCVSSVSSPLRRCTVPLGRSCT